MSSTAASRKFPWQVVRGPSALIAIYLIGYDIKHGVTKNQWWFPFALVLLAAITMIAEEIYDEPLPGNGLGPKDMSNFTCMLVGLGIPVAALASGIARGGWLWWAGALAVLAANMVVYFGFRQRGLSALVVLVCLLALAVG